MSVPIIAFAPDTPERPDTTQGYDGCGALYSRYHRPLLAYLRRVCPAADAEAVVQDTFCRVMSHWVEVRHMANPWPWLAVTARNLAFNQVRDDGRTQPVGLLPAEDVVDPYADVDARIEATDQLRRIGAAMKGLTPGQRRLLAAVLDGGLNGAEAARRLGMRPASVRMQLCRLRARLAEELTVLGGRMAVVPLVVLRVLGSGLRRTGTTAHKRAPAIGLPAAATIPMALAVAMGVITPTLLLRNPPAPAAVDHPGATASAADGSTQPAPLVSADRAAAAHPTMSGAATTVVAPKVTPPLASTHHAYVSGHPVSPGRSADVGVTVVTPVTTITVEVPVYQDDHPPVCRLRPQTC